MNREELLQEYQSGRRDFSEAYLHNAYLHNADLSNAYLTPGHAYAQNLVARARRMRASALRLLRRRKNHISLRMFSGVVGCAGEIHPGRHSRVSCLASGDGEHG